jgi:predicted dienelactone hydrolase
VAAPGLAAAVCDGAITDRARNRDIPVRVQMPEGGAGKAPLILFSHGFAVRWTPGPCLRANV